MKKTVVMCMLALSLCLIAAGCGKKEEETEVKEAEKVVIEEEEVEYQIIGNENEDAYEILLTNSTGKDIVGIAVKTSDKTEYPSNMMKSDEVLKDGVTAKLFYTPEESSESVDTEKAVNVVYNVQITLADNTVYELSSFGFDDIKEEAELYLEDDVVFVKYISKTTDDEISTKEQELGAKAQKEAQEAAEKAAAEAAAQAAAEAAAQSQASESYTEEYYYVPEQNYQQPTYEAPVEQAPAQDSESCLGGVIVNP